MKNILLAVTFFSTLNQCSCVEFKFFNQNDIPIKISLCIVSENIQDDFQRLDLGEIPTFETKTITVPNAFATDKTVISFNLSAISKLRNRKILVPIEFGCSLRELVAVTGDQKIPDNTEAICTVINQSIFTLVFRFYDDDFSADAFLEIVSNYGVVKPIKCEWHS